VTNKEAFDNAVYAALISKTGLPLVDDVSTYHNGISDTYLFDAILLGTLTAATNRAVMIEAIERARKTYREYRPAEYFCFPTIPAE